MVNVASDCATILLKRGSIVDCVDLGTHLNQIRAGPHANLFTNLTVEHKAVKASLQSHSQSQQQQHNHSIIQSQPLQECHHNHTIARARKTPEFLFSDAISSTPYDPDVKDAPSLDPILVGGPSKHQVRGQSPWPFGSDEDTPAVTVKQERTSSVISLPPTEDTGVQVNSLCQVSKQPTQPRRAPSVISLSSMDSIDKQGRSYTPGPSHHPHQPHCMLSVISLSSEDEGASEHHHASNRPSRASSPIIERRSQSLIDDHRNTNSDAIDIDMICVWPYEFHAGDIRVGFQKCQQAVHLHHKVSMVFQKYFGTRFMKSTYYDHRRYWMDVVDDSVRMRYIGYGHTDQGLWSAFLENERRNREDV